MIDPRSSVRKVDNREETYSPYVEMKAYGEIMILYSVLTYSERFHTAGQKKKKNNKKITKKHTTHFFLHLTCDTKIKINSPLKIIKAAFPKQAFKKKKNRETNLLLGCLNQFPVIS